MDFVSENVFGRSQKTQRKVPNLPNTLYDHFVFWYLRGNYVNFEGVGGSDNAPLILFFLHIPLNVLILKCWALHRCQMCWHFTVTYYSSQLANLFVSKLFGDWNCFGENSAVCAKSIRMWFETIFSHFVLVCLGWRKANSGPWEQLLANWVCFLISLFVSCVCWSVCFLISLFEINKNLLSLNAELLPEPDVLLVEVADLLHCEDGEQAGEQHQDDAAKKIII